MIGTQIFQGTNARAGSWRRVTPYGSRRVRAVLRALMLGIAASVGCCAALVGAGDGRGSGFVPQRTGAHR